jgi:hypothetical protein
MFLGPPSPRIIRDSSPSILSGFDLELSGLNQILALDPSTSLRFDFGIRARVEVKRARSKLVAKEVSHYDFFFTEREGGRPLLAMSARNMW